jgi:hypothetical protein
MPFAQRSQKNGYELRDQEACLVADFSSRFGFGVYPKNAENFLYSIYD